MTVQPLFPHEIAAFLRDSGLIYKAAADRLETRIAAYGERRLRLQAPSRVPISAPPPRKFGEH